MILCFWSWETMEAPTMAITEVSERRERRKEKRGREGGGGGEEEKGNTQKMSTGREGGEKEIHKLRKSSVIDMSLLFIFTGASEEELNAALFMYSKRPLSATHTKNNNNNNNKHRKLTTSSSPASSPLTYRSIPQIDFVPTLALLLGIPIPFGSIGGIIPEIFFGPQKDILQKQLVESDSVSDVDAIASAMTGGETEALKAFEGLNTVRG